MTDETEKALDALRGAVLDAETVVPIRQQLAPPEMAGAAGAAAPPASAVEDSGAGEDGGGDDGDDRRRLNEHGLPEGCPVTPLGKEEKTYFYLDALGQVIPLSARDHNHNHFRAIFSPYTDYLEAVWPRKKQVAEGVWETIGFKPEAVANDLMNACARKGVWNPSSKVRGVGAWLDDDGALLFHCGDRLVTKAGEREPGFDGGYVYPSYRRVPAPADKPEPPHSTPGSAAEILLNVLSSWNWHRSAHNIDARLALGWIGSAFAGGALDWRPMGFLTGDSGSGKSTLFKLLKYLFDDGIIMTSDSSAAGLYQEVGLSSMPVIVDEIEAAEDNRRAVAVINLARLASSGAVMLRGGAEHKGVQFTARSCFLFSAILMPPLEPQDLNRMAILRLDPLPHGKTPPLLDRKYYRDIGQRLKRRLFDQWPRFDETLSRYRMVLAKAGHSSRGCDQFGTLLACSDLLMFNDPPESDELEAWEELLQVGAWREIHEGRSNSEQCLDYIMQSQPEAWRSGHRRTVSELLDEWRETPAAFGDVQKALGAGGLKIVGEAYLAVANAHRQTALMYKDTKWAGKPGMTGGWVQALERLEGALVSRNTRIAGQVVKATHVPLDLVASDKDRSAQRADTASPSPDTLD